MCGPLLEQAFYSKMGVGLGVEQIYVISSVPFASCLWIMMWIPNPSPVPLLLACLPIAMLPVMMVMDIFTPLELYVPSKPFIP